MASIHDRETLQFFSARFMTFTAEFTKKSDIAPGLLSENGFFYDQTEDSLKCIDCSFSHKNTFTRITDILLEHFRQNDECIQSKKSVLALTKDTPEVHWPGLNKRAYHPAFSNIQIRVETFKTWPANITQQPAELAKAGFYYYGIVDKVKCFFCNLGLEKWNPNDDPFEDHVRWYPKCEYITHLMGHEYVEKVKLKYSNTESAFMNNSAVSQQNSINTTNDISYDVIPSRSTSFSVISKINDASCNLGAYCLKAYDYISKKLPKSQPESSKSLIDLSSTFQRLAARTGLIKDTLNQPDVIQSKTDDSIQTKTNELNEPEGKEILNEKDICVVCLDKKRNCVFLTCSHLVSCMECSLSLKNCPVCREKIRTLIRVMN